MYRTSVKRQGCVTAVRYFFGFMVVFVGVFLVFGILSMIGYYVSPPPELEFGVQWTGQR